MLFTPEQSSIIIAGLVGAIVTLLGVAPFYIKARAKQAIANGEAATIKSKAEAAKEVIEVDGLKFVLQVAQQGMKTAERLSELEREVAAGKFRELEKDRLVDTLTSDLRTARTEIQNLRDRVAELTTELEQYKKAEKATIGEV